ncbi:MAG: ferritin-like domain-containing protein [Acidobacteriota bacterium]
MAEAKIQIDTHLDAPVTEERESLNAILASALKNKANFQAVKEASEKSCWSASHFGLDQVALFNQSTDDERQEILQGCSANVLAEAYYIEKCGMYFAPKMSLLAESVEEKMLYNLFAADETMHFSWIAQFVNQKAIENYLHNPFIQMLAEILRREDKTTLTYIVQIILEGWGINHYNLLMKNCCDARLRQIFEQILKDEARHHGSGLILFNEKRLTAKHLETISEILIGFFRMVQVGPQMVVAQIEQIKGHLSTAQKTQIFNELSCEQETAKRIETLKSFIRAARYEEVIIERLERAKVFDPFTASACAMI